MIYKFLFGCCSCVVCIFVVIKMVNELLNHIKQISQDYILKHQYKSALYWADKAASLSHYQLNDVYHLAQCMFMCKQYERAAILIMKRQLHIKKTAFRYLAAKCFVESKQHQTALDLLDAAQQNSNAPKKMTDSVCIDDGIPDDKDLVASIHLLKGDIYEALDVREAAVECYKEALKCDVFSFEAFDRLTSHHMLRAEEEDELLESLPFPEQCQSKKEQKLLLFLYNSMLKKYNKPSKFDVPDDFDNLNKNLDVAASLAERHYYNCEFRTSFSISEGIIKQDPYHMTCLPLHVALLVELKEANKLFYLAHQLVAKYPDLPISWHAVGCYYLLHPKKQELCRRYLLKATILDKMFGPAWLAYGHSFALQNEHDQAMAAYFTASQLMRGCHLPFLYIGLEYSVTNNTKLAEKFFSAALEIGFEDPHVLHEMGVAYFNSKDYKNALKYFNKALDQVRVLGSEVQVEEWEPLLNNLGHTYRKLEDYPRALECHRHALTLSPHSAETYSAIGFVYSYMGNYMEAVEYLHKSLGLRRDDVFTSSLLDIVIQKFSEIDLPLSGEALPPETPTPPLLTHKAPESSFRGLRKTTLFTDLSITDQPMTSLESPSSSSTHISGDLPTTSRTKSSRRVSRIRPRDGVQTRSGGRILGGDTLSFSGDDMEMDDSI